MSVENAPIGPVRVAFPIVNSTTRSGTDQRRRKQTQATRNEPPPLAAAMRGNRQMLPVPTAMPSIASNIPQRDVNVGCCVTVDPKVRDSVMDCSFPEGPNTHARAD